ncbi:DNA polymerase alpha subunit b [Phtheirospermum japonicum]|uniref:DNA polymerase alpha subunit B n=1 Tax=Phtheirospermum japonicum TaxID=374723 RepID=A0A830D847_9LAMI|nr:DNA polymerase alpha subunit b [Phtheirospermum japonicum]
MAKRLFGLTFVKILNFYIQNLERPGLVPAQLNDGLKPNRGQNGKMIAKMEDEIKAEFTKNGFILDDEEEIIQKCLTFCIQYKLSASDLVSSWEVYSLNWNLDLTVPSSHMGAFLEQLQSEQKDKIRERDLGLHLYSNDVAMILDGNYEDKEGILDTPTDKRTLAHERLSDSSQKTNGSKFTFEKPLESVTPFGSRKSKFVVQAMLSQQPSMQSVKVEEDSANPEDDYIIKRPQPIQKCSLLINRSQPEPGCRFMYDRIEDKFNFLENCIKKRTTAYVSSGQYEEPVDPSVASQKSIFTVGMICCEEEGRLKEKPVLLQSSVEHSGGQRVRLDLQKLNHFSIFPGQVVGIEGHNPSGHCLIASKIIDYVPFSVTSSQYPSKRQTLDHDRQLTNPSQAMAELSLIVAAGPFTTSDNLLFEPLTELLAYARRKQPQLLVLLGPFVDSDHPELRKGNVNQTFDEIFRLGILEKLQDYVECMGSAANVILMPSIRDANHDFVFPQPAFEIHPTDFSNQIYSISNPGMFCANEVNVACCTVDILKHLSAEEICRNPPGGSKQRLTNLAKHILNQHRHVKRFYPLYPPAEDVPLDFSLANKALQFSSIPDILVLPSDLTHFVKVLSLGEEGNDGEEQIKKCICVNPGRLARGEGGGFFVEINYSGNPDSSSASVIRI